MDISRGRRPAGSHPRSDLRLEQALVSGITTGAAPRRTEVRVAANLFANLTARNIRIKYRGSILGVFWTLLNPLVMMAIYTVVFSLIVRVAIHPYFLFLLAGLIPWTAFNQGLTLSAVSIVSNAPLVKKVYFRLELLPLSEVATAGINFGISLGLVVLGVLIYRRGLDITIVLLPLLVALQLLFMAGLGLALSALTCYFRDIEYILNLGLVAWFYGTPVIYPRSLVPARLQVFLDINPMSWLIGAYQDVIFYQRWPDPRRVLGFAVVTALVCAGSWLWFHRVRPDIPEEL